MKRKRYTDEQIAFAVRQAEPGTPLGGTRRHPASNNPVHVFPCVPKCPRNPSTQAREPGQVPISRSA